MNTMSPEAIAAAAGAVLSLLFNYIPGLNSRFDRLSADQQRLSMAGLLAVTAIGMAIWTGNSDWRAILTNFVFALIANQGIDRIAPKPRGDQ